MDRDEALGILASFGWSGEALDLGIAAEFCCEYCHRDLLATIYDYDSWQTDHIVPVARGGSDDPRNHALACKTCNFLKRHSVPSAAVDPLTDRKAAIVAIREMLVERRNAKQAHLDKVRDLFRPVGWRPMCV